MDSYTRDIAVVDWLEEVPIDELPEGAKDIADSFRCGMIDVLEAIALLEHDCSDELDEYVERNLEIQKLLE